MVLGLLASAVFSSIPMLAAIAAAAAAAKSLQSCPTLCDSIDGSPPGSSVHGIFQARVLEWGSIAFSDPNAYFLSILQINFNICFLFTCVFNLFFLIRE